MNGRSRRGRKDRTIHLEDGEAHYMGAGQYVILQHCEDGKLPQSVSISLGDIQRLVGALEQSAA